MVVKIEVNKTDLNHVLACLANLKTLVTETLHKGIPEASAREFAIQLKENLIGQKFASGYKPLGTWKKNEPMANKFWEWYGEALTSINFTKVNNDSWFAGFKSGGAAIGTGVSKKVGSVPDRLNLIKVASERYRAQRVAGVKIWTKEEIAQENIRRAKRI